MDIPKETLEKLTTRSTSKIKNERQAIIKEFLDRLNVAGRKPLNPAFVSMRMSHAGLKTNFDLYQFLAMCKQARNFHEYWWWSLKANKKTI